MRCAFPQTMWTSCIVRSLSAFLLLNAFALPSRAAGPADELNTHLPDDTLAFLELNPTVGAPSAPGGNSLIDVGLQAARTLGVVPRTLGLATDGLSFAGIAGKYRNTLALLDADLVPAGDAAKGQFECRSVQIVWLLQTGGTIGKGGENGIILRKLSDLLGWLSSKSTAHQAIRKTPEGKREYVEFWDDAWPKWMRVSWVQEDDRFVLAFGAGAMAHYLAGRSVAGVPWKAYEASADFTAKSQNGGGDPVVRFFAASRQFADRFPAVIQSGRLHSLFQAFELDQAEAGLLTGRLTGRELSFDSATLLAQGGSWKPWTTRLKIDDPLLKTIPADATYYTVLNVEWPLSYQRIVALVDAALPNASQSLDGTIASFAERQSVDIRKDILDQMAPRVVIYNSPAPPLGIPLFFTGILAARPEAKGGVQNAMEHLLVGARTDLQHHEGVNRSEYSGGSTKSDLSRLTLRQDADGVEYIQFGLLGPAWSWKGDQLVYSWSPVAVRTVLPSVSISRAK